MPTRETRPIYIYALTEPDSGDIRYVGKSVRPHGRLENHCNDPAVTWRTNWIRSLAAQGKKPGLQILEKLHHTDDWQAAEKRWIAYGRENGWRLTNCTDGGDGVANLPPETRERMRQTWLGRKHRPESLERIGAASRGRHHTEEHKAHMSELMSGRQITWGDKISARLRKLTDDQVREIRCLISDGVRLSHISERFSVDTGTISNIKRGRFYGDVR